MGVALNISDGKHLNPNILYYYYPIFLYGEKRQKMKKKIVGIFVCMLLIATAILPVSGNIENDKIKILNFKESVIIQPPEEWNKTYGGTGTDHAFSVQQTSDRGYIMTGTTFSFAASGFDCWLIKTSSNGTEQWNETFNFSSNDIGLCVKQTSDGGYIMTGITHLPPNDVANALLIKTDDDGDEQWNKTFGELLTYSDYGLSVIQTSEGPGGGGYALIGGTTSYGAGDSDVWLIKTDANGIEQWNKTFGKTSLDGGHEIHQTLDGGYIIAGAMDYDFWLIKTDNNGTEQWNKTFEGTITSTDLESLGYRGGLSVQQTQEGGFIVTGITDSYGAAGNDALLIKTDANGNELWKKRFGGDAMDEGFCLDQTSEGGCVITGTTNTNEAGSYMALLIKVAPPQTDISCEGDLNWIDVTPGSTVQGNFMIENIGDNGTLLDWYIYNWPKWGNWTFTPASGEDLTPEDGPVTINVTVIAPNEENKEFTGTVRINNKENTIYCTIDIELITPKNKPYNINLLFQRFLKNHPQMFPILKLLLGQ